MSRERLREKYRLLLELREEREEAQRQGMTGFPESRRAERRAAMKALAAELPGSLRELDESSAEELRVRLHAIDSGSEEPWMDAAIVFHDALREALLVRRGVALTITCWEPAELDALRSPPTGRLLDVVWRSIAARLGVTPQVAERLIYPRAPTRRIRPA